MGDDFENLQRQLAANVRRRRTALGLSQERLALETDIDRTYVSQIERGICNPSLLILSRVALRLETSVAVLLGQDD